MRLFTVFTKQNQEKFSTHSLSDLILNRNQKVDCVGFHGADKAYLLSGLYKTHKLPIVIVVSSARQAEAFIKDTEFFLKRPVKYFPPDKSPLHFISSYNEPSVCRVRILYEMATENMPPVVVICAESLTQPIISKKDLCSYAELVMEGEDIDRESLIKKLVSGGYEHSAIVEDPGDFCVRGGILDVFSPLYPDPIRIEFFGDTVDSLRFFSAATQRKLKPVGEAVILPVKEVADNLSDSGTFSEYLPDNAVFIMDEPAESVPEQWAEIEKFLEDKYPVSFKTFPNLEAAHPTFQFSIQDNTTISLDLKNYREKENRLTPLADWIKDKQQSGYTVLMVCSTSAQAERAASLLKFYGIRAISSQGLPENKAAKGLFHLCIGQLSAGFVWHDESLAMITEDEIFGKKQRRKAAPIRQDSLKTKLFALEDLKKGDVIVHTEHGIGRYQGLEKISVEGIVNDFLLIVYRDEDKLYLPVYRMNMIEKYMGIDDALPMLDKMGGKTWEKVREKVKKSVEKIAGELLKLYAERKIAKGHAFSRPDNYFQDFEAGFPYEETEDQLKTIEDVLEDMAKEEPMDRLVCGDVGYGKTEVALRAAFIAVNDSRQVAVLVPTTILAEQHFETFSTRFKHYPVRIACLNRFRSSKEQKDIIKGLKDGTIDIVIGTHRLIQKDVNFKNLGLIVIDEEHRFGVKHKEKLKKLRTNVDVLALTATPIPRTLHLSLSGVRDISLISTPPEDRFPIKTYICQFNKALISDAIRKELDRKGQIFFVHNNIRSIGAVANMIRELVPEVRSDIAHGQMGEDELEKIMIRFKNKEIDLLVCTTIIESGLDIPSANTIMINRAERFGLAQIYQLRGRVGRADEQAYSYLFIPHENALSKDAQKRLKVLMEHSDLGAGFQIAMNDLKIRGGGTILGASQSGHIAAVGYDMFLTLMENAISELKGEEIKVSLDPEINIPMSAFIPESYISDIDQRLGAYRRLAKMTELKEISDFKDELTDRFGALPEEAGNLLMKIMLKVLCIKAGVKRLDLVGQHLTLKFSDAHQKHPGGLADMIMAAPQRFEFTPDHVLKIRVSKSGIGALSETRNILKEIRQHVSPNNG